MSAGETAAQPCKFKETGMDLRIPRQSDMAQMLAGFPLFQALDETCRARVATRARERRLDRNEILFQKGDPARSLYLVVYGQIKLALPGANGNEKVVELVGPLQNFGEESLLTDSPHPVFAQAVTPSLLVQIQKDAIHDLVECAPAFARSMLANLARHARKLIQDVETYTQHRGAQRVIGYLHDHCPAGGNPDVSIAVTLPASKQLIASRLNLTPETFSRILRDLEEASLIEVQGKQIRINNLRRLREYDS